MYYCTTVVQIIERKRRLSIVIVVSYMQLEWGTMKYMAPYLSRTTLVAPTLLIVTSANMLYHLKHAFMDGV